MICWRAGLPHGPKMIKSIFCFKLQLFYKEEEHCSSRCRTNTCLRQIELWVLFLLDHDVIGDSCQVTGSKLKETSVSEVLLRFRRICCFLGVLLSFLLHPVSLQPCQEVISWFLTKLLMCRREESKTSSDQTQIQAAAAVHHGPFSGQTGWIEKNVDKT